MINLTAVGHLVSDPEQKTIESKAPRKTELTLVSFRIISNEKKNNKDIATPIDCSIWGKKGQAAMSFLKKGDQVTVVGFATLNLNTKNDGTPSGAVNLTVERYILPPKSKAMELTSDMPF